MDVEDLGEVGLVGFGDTVVAGGDRGAVLGGDVGEAVEGVEADDFSAVVVGFVYAAEGGEEGEVVSPADAELHDGAVDGSDLGVEIVHVEDAAEGLAGGV